MNFLIYLLSHILESLFEICNDILENIGKIAGTDKYVEIPNGNSGVTLIGISIMFVMIILILTVSTKYIKNFQYNI